MENRLIQEKAIRIFEEQFHCRLCCHDYSGQLQSVPLPQYHLNPFCTGLKEHKNKLTELCIEFDRDKVQHQLLRTHPRPFFKCCHCGMREAVFPIVADGKLYGVIFAGPFQPRREPEELINPQTHRLPLKLRLPVLKPEQEEPFLAYGMLIASCLALQIRKPPHVPNSRREMIEAFLETNCVRDIGLADLAETLSLTPPRASEAVRNLFGLTFCALLRKKRLEKAMLLLSNSSFTMDSVARRCGFRDAAYFHRVFRKNTGITPVRFRLENKVNEA